MKDFINHQQEAMTLMFNELFFSYQFRYQLFQACIFHSRSIRIF